MWKIKQIIQHILKMQYIYLLPKYVIISSFGWFLHVFAYKNIGHLTFRRLTSTIVDVPHH